MHNGNKLLLSVAYCCIKHTTSKT